MTNQDDVIIHDYPCRACGQVVNITSTKIVYSHIKSICGGFATCSVCGSETIVGEINYEELYLSRNSSNYPLKKSILVFFKNLFLRRVAKNYVKQSEIGSRILDYGCGGGELANALCSIGFDNVFATDLQISRPNTLNVGINYFEIGALEQQELFDIVILRHVIEHLEYPVEVLQSIKSRLHPKGIVIVEFPWVGSYWKKLMGFYWPGYFFPYHTMILSQAGAHQIFKRANLRVKSISSSEPPIFGVFFMSMGVPRSVARLFSGILFPVQVLVSRLKKRSEALVFNLVDKNF